MYLPLTNNYTLNIEPHLKNAARVVILQNGEEIACRKETLKTLRQFLESPNGNLFKGRLQLHGSPSGVSIKLKGNELGVLPAELLRQSLNAINRVI